MSAYEGKNWKANPGKLPRGAKGKRVRVVLERDRETMTEPTYNPMSPPGWAADGKGGCNWSIRKDWPFNIAFYQVI